MVQLFCSRFSFTPIGCLSCLAFVGYLHYQVKAIREFRAQTSIAPEAATPEGPTSGTGITKKATIPAVSIAVATEAGLDYTVTTGSRSPTPRGESQQPAVELMTQNDFCDVTLSAEW